MHAIEIKNMFVNTVQNAHTVLTQYIVALETQSPSKHSRRFYFINLKDNCTKKTKAGKDNATMSFVEIRLEHT